MATQAVSGNSVGKIGLADAPAVELALSEANSFFCFLGDFSIQRKRNSIITCKKVNSSKMGSQRSRHWKKV